MLERAAQRVRAQVAPFAQLWFDGFFAFSKAELALLAALRQKASLTVTLPEWEGAAPLVEEFRRAGARIERLAPLRPAPSITLLEAASREREAEEVALRILEQRAQGRPWRAMGVILRSEESYLALLERTFHRAGIPFRAYFGHAVRRQPAFHLVQRFMRAVESGWDGEASLALLRHPLCRPRSQLQGDAYGAAIEALPFRGWDQLCRHAGAAADALAPFAGWPALSLPPREWARQLARLASLLEPPPAGGPLQPEHLLDFRLRAAAFSAILDAAESAARLLPDEPLPLAAFWGSAEDSLADASFYLEDRRRDAVHILDVEEARQWELPVVFVCGLLEGEFPRRPSPDPILPEELRLALNTHGFPVRTRAAREAEERFLFDIARSRATAQLVLSWPARNEKGNENLRAFLLDSIQAGEPEGARRLRVRPGREAQPAPRPALQSDQALRHLRQIHPKLAATAIESFLQCPFQFFARYTLQLKPLPPLPSGRLDMLLLGTLAHMILAEWQKRRGSIKTVTDELWDRELRCRGLAETHQSILARAAMKRALASYAAQAAIHEGWSLRPEENLQLFEQGVEIHGRADRVDVSPEGDCIVYDFKYSGAQSIRQRKDIAVQGGLYAEALARAENLRPVGIYLVALKDDGKLIGSKTAQEAQEEIRVALENTRHAIEQMQSGRIEVDPAVQKLCDYCEYRDACRWQQEAAAVRAAGGEGGEEEE